MQLTWYRRSGPPSPLKSFFVKPRDECLDVDTIFMILSKWLVGIYG